MPAGRDGCQQVQKKVVAAHQQKSQRVSSSVHNVASMHWPVGASRGVGSGPTLQKVVVV